MSAKVTTGKQTTQRISVAPYGTTQAIVLSFLANKQLLLGSAAPMPPSAEVSILLGAPVFDKQVILKGYAQPCTLEDLGGNGYGVLVHLSNISAEMDASLRDWEKRRRSGSQEDSDEIEDEDSESMFDSSVKKTNKKKPVIAKVQWQMTALHRFILSTNWPIALACIVTAIVCLFSLQSPITFEGLVFRIAVAFASTVFVTAFAVKMMSN